MTQAIPDRLSAQVSAAFPTELRPHLVSAVANAIPDDYGPGVHFRDNPDRVFLADESVRVLHRHGLRPRTPESAIGIESAIRACLASCHFDGHVRQRSIPAIFETQEIWAMPFILELASDYVIEVLEELDQHFQVIDLGPLHRYVAENSKHLEVVEARIVSYWNENYRASSRSLEAETYPGFRILHRLKGP